MKNTTTRQWMVEFKEGNEFNYGEQSGAIIYPSYLLSGILELSIRYEHGYESNRVQVFIMENIRQKVSQ